MPKSEPASCIELCAACLIACERCAAACLEEADVPKMVRCLRLSTTCADLCGLAVREMARASDLVYQVAALCAEACRACAAACEEHLAAEHCRRCAEACRRCEAECRKLAA